MGAFGRLNSYRLLGMTQFHLPASAGHALIAIGIVLIVIVYWVFKS